MKAWTKSVMADIERYGQVQESLEIKISRIGEWADVESKKKGVVLDDCNTFGVGYRKILSVTSWGK